MLVGMLILSTVSWVRAHSTQIETNQVLDDALNYLQANYNDEVGLICESPDEEFKDTYWVYSDNFLASIVLHNYGQSDTLVRMAGDITSKMPNYLNQAGVCNPMNQYMVLRESVFYFDNAQPVILAKVGNATVKTTMNNRIGDPLLPWNYSDVAFLQAVYYHELGNESGAMKSYLYGVNRSDGIGFKDDAFNDTHLYETYKLALYIYASTMLGQEDYNRPAFDQALGTLVDMQQHTSILDNGGFATYYDSNGTAKPGVNTETTSLAVLAVMVTQQVSPIPEFGMTPLVIIGVLVTIALTREAEMRKAH